MTATCMFCGKVFGPNEPRGYASTTGKYSCLDAPRCAEAHEGKTLGEVCEEEIAKIDAACDHEWGGEFLSALGDGLIRVCKKCGADKPRGEAMSITRMSDGSCGDPKCSCGKPSPGAEAKGGGAGMMQHEDTMESLRDLAKFYRERYEEAESQLEAAEKLVRGAMPIIRAWVAKNPSWYYEGKLQDPEGGNAWLNEYAALNSTLRGQEAGNDKK